MRVSAIIQFCAGGISTNARAIIQINLDLEWVSCRLTHSGVNAIKCRTEINN